MSEILTLAARGDMAALTRLYTDVYEKIYYVAYYSLATQKEASQALLSAFGAACEEIEKCVTQDAFNILFLEKVCDEIIARYREYRKAPPQSEQNPSFIKVCMSRLTDAERLSVAIWATFGLDAEGIAQVTGLNGAAISKKLESGKEKLAQKL